MSLPTAGWLELNDLSGPFQPKTPYNSIKKHLYELLCWPDTKAPLHRVWYLAPPSRQRAGVLPGTCSPDSAPDLWDLPTTGRDLVPRCAQCSASGACDPHLEQRETKHSTCKDAFFNQPCEFVSHKYDFSLWEQNHKFLRSHSMPTETQDLLQ